MTEQELQESKAQWNEADYYLNQDISERRSEMKVHRFKEERAIGITQDSILIIAAILLPFTDEGREYVIKEALEIAARLTSHHLKVKIKKGTEE